MLPLRIQPFLLSGRVRFYEEQELRERVTPAISPFRGDPTRFIQGVAVSSAARSRASWAFTDPPRPPGPPDLFSLRLARSRDPQRERVLY